MQEELDLDQKWWRQVEAVAAGASRNIIHLDLGTRKTMEELV
jgi:hypothetical protein